MISSRALTVAKTELKQLLLARDYWIPMAALGAIFVAVLIAERPGLSVPESLGVYVTLNPEVGRTDAERNCISNIHPDGLTVEVAADRFARLLVRARAVGATGVALGGSERDGADGGRGVLGS